MMLTSPPPRLPRAFWALNISQFWSVFLDMHIRTLLVAGLVIRETLSRDRLSALPLMVVVALSVAAPLIFAPLAGVVADRADKRRVLTLAGMAGVALSAATTVGFYLDATVVLYVLIFLQMVRGCFVEVCKYSALPEVADPVHLSRSSGCVSAFTCLALLGGAAAALCSHPDALQAAAASASLQPLWPYAALSMVFAAAAWGAALLAPPLRPQAPEKRIHGMCWREIGLNLQLRRSNRYLALAMYAIGFFYFLAAWVMVNIPAYMDHYFRQDTIYTGGLLAIPILGVFLGAQLAGGATSRGVEIGLAPFGALVVSLCLPLLMLPALPFWAVAGALGLAGMGGAFFLVPLRAYLLREAPDWARGGMTANSVFLGATGVAAGLILWLLFAVALPTSPAIRFLALGVLTLALGVTVVRALPDFLIRFLGLLVARVSYRLRVLHEERVPIAGGALLVCNHVSYLDVALLLATQPRRIRFLMDRSVYDRRGVGWLLRTMGAIRIAYDEGDAVMERAYDEARREIEAGFLVCLFAEGSLTRTGYIMEFKQGFERITEGLDAPIIPVNIFGVWGTVFTHAEGTYRERLSRWLRGRRALVSFGEPLPAGTDAFTVRQKVMELCSEAYAILKEENLPLPLEFVKIARQRWNRRCMSDTLGRDLTYGKTLIGALALARALRRDLDGQDRVGLLMPTSVAGALANVAVSFLGKVPVNLNYTASQEAMDSAIRQSAIQTVLTSRKFLQKLGREEAPGMVCLEDLARRITPWIKLRSFALARFCPVQRLMPPPSGQPGAWLDQTAVIIFSSGSTGEPKGVILSHHNILSNVFGIREVMQPRPDDVICGILPFFHSFGFTATIWLPLLAGIAVAYHPNPMEAATIGRLVADHKCAFLIGTPTFMQTYIRKIPREQFASLRLVVTGAEKLKPRLAEAFERQFGIAPMEGYGTTELAPVASVNLPNREKGGEYQVSHRPGSIGRPIPGVTMKVVDPDDLSCERRHGEEGMLLVKGPNVMQGYLGRPDLTEQVLIDGWYVTGDIARIDHDGFVTITDRLSRFSKIGGEMVPHLAIEEALHEALGAEGQVCAVTSLPDDRKGEKLVLLLTPEAGDVEGALEKLRTSGLPNLWIPAASNIHTVESLPMLGTGKLDLKGLKDLALERYGQERDTEA